MRGRAGRKCPEGAEHASPSGQRPGLPTPQYKKALNGRHNRENRQPRMTSVLSVQIRVSSVAVCCFSLSQPATGEHVSPLQTRHMSGSNNSVGVTVTATVERIRFFALGPKDEHEEGTSDRTQTPPSISRQRSGARVAPQQSPILPNDKFDYQQSTTSTQVPPVELPCGIVQFFINGQIFFDQRDTAVKNAGRLKRRHSF